MRTPHRCTGARHALFKKRRSLEEAAYIYRQRGLHALVQVPTEEVESVGEWAPRYFDSA
jgi:hypothetical protein